MSEDTFSDPFPSIGILAALYFGQDYRRYGTTIPEVFNAAKSDDKYLKHYLANEIEHFRKIYASRVDAAFDELYGSYVDLALWGTTPEKFFDELLRLIPLPLEPLRDFEAPSRHEITPEALVASRPTWSLDEQWLIFEGTKGQETSLYKVRPDGTNLQPLAACNHPGTDSRGRVCFMSEEEILYVSDRSGKRAIWKCHLSDGAVAQLTFPGDDESDADPTILPDGDQIFLFTRTNCKSANNRLMLSDAHTPATPEMVILDAQQPCLIPGTRSVIYFADRASDGALYVKNVDDAADGVRVTWWGALCTAQAHPSVSADGKHVALTNRGERWPELMTMRIDGSHSWELPIHNTGYLHPAWSPSGRYLAVTAIGAAAANPAGSLQIVELTRATVPREPAHDVDH